MRLKKLVSRIPTDIIGQDTCDQCRAKLRTPGNLAKNAVQAKDPNQRVRRFQSTVARQRQKEKENNCECGFGKTLGKSTMQKCLCHARKLQ